MTEKDLNKTETTPYKTQSTTHDDIKKSAEKAEDRGKLEARTDEDEKEKKTNQISVEDQNIFKEQTIGDNKKKQYQSQGELEVINETKNEVLSTNHENCQLEEILENQQAKPNFKELEQEIVDKDVNENDQII